MEVSALKHAGAAGMHGSSPLLRLQTDERLIALIRRGNHSAFEALVKRYQARLLAFCRHMLGSKEDAEDVLQEVFAAAFNAILADERAINVRPWLYRIARNRSLNHLRRVQAIGVDSMDIHFSEAGMTTAEKVHKREDFRLLLSDVGELPETQRTALLLREIDALSYDQIAEAMETTVPSVKSLLVRARVSLAEAAEARLLSCDDVRLELGEVAEGLKRMSPPVRRHVKTCERCANFRQQLKETNKALAAVFPIGPLLLVKKFVLAHLGTTTAAGGGAAAGTSAAGAGAGAGAGGILGAGVSTIATKAAATVAAAAIVTAGAVEVRHAAVDPSHRRVVAVAPPAPAPPARAATPAPAPVAGSLAKPDPAFTVKPDPKPAEKTDPKATTADQTPGDGTGGDVAQVPPPVAATPATTTPATTTPAAPPPPAPKPTPAPAPQTDESTAVLPGDDTTTTPPQVTDTVQAPPSATTPAAPPGAQSAPAPVATTPAPVTTPDPAVSAPAPVAPPAGETP